MPNKKGTPKACLSASLRDAAHTRCALFPPNLAFGKEGGQACRAGARGVSFPVSPEPETYPGGAASPPGLLQKKRADAKHLLSGNSILAELLLLSACSLRLLAALDARAFIMLTLTELGKRTRLCTRTLETTQCAVNRFIFLDADLRHSFPSLRAFLYGGRFAQSYLPWAHKTVRILYLFFPPMSTKIFHERTDFTFFILRRCLQSCPEQRSA